ncbi:lipid storage droplets surface-binding protein 1-like isoform X2 [Adelges cooleyi]|uniref:lipid storage droplets surface-binding protein 1-like isoform X2 n=1 Tax=Adelges cooleyi TaxID=133065 RepID=UPI00217F5F4D|nr:lipid storage droplets surface-binding protein 1-like isoform X2 [Adelges cooleyi]
MTETSKQDFPQFVAIKRILKLPVVSSGVDKATYIYVRVKNLNRVFEYGFGNAENTVWTVVDLSVPLVAKLEDPINKIDEIMCKSLDVVEQNVPFITYTPEEIYYSTKTYVKDKVAPVLKRADSVKQLSMLDDALSVADKYVDKYLPDQDSNEDATENPKPSSQAVKTIRHVNRFSRKLQRRLTRRTIAEAKLLKKQGYDTVQCLVYFADLLAKDPKEFAQKIKVIWEHLSEDEPENQKPPENIEQLLELLTRESARRFVHATNFVSNKIAMGPTYAKRAFHTVTQETAVLVDKIFEFTHLQEIRDTVEGIAKKQLVKYTNRGEEIKKLILEYLSTLTQAWNTSGKKTQDQNNENSKQTNEKDKQNSSEEKQKKKTLKANGEKKEKPAEQTSSSSTAKTTAPVSS